MGRKSRYFEHLIERMVNESKYDCDNIYDAVKREALKLDELTCGPFVSKIYLFGENSGKRVFHLDKMMVLFEDGSTLWYDFYKNKGKVDTFVLYASLLAECNGSSIYNLYSNDQILFLHSKYAGIFEGVSSLIKVPEFFCSMCLTQLLISASYILKCENLRLDLSEAILPLLSDALLPLSLPISFLTLYSFGRNFFKTDKYMKRYFSKFEPMYCNFDKSLFFSLYALAIVNSVTLLGLNSEKLFNTAIAIEKTIDNVFSDVDLENIDQFWCYQQLDGAIENNTKLSDVEKELCLRNLEVITGDYDFDYEKLYYVFSTLKTYSIDCVVGSGDDKVVGAMYCQLNNAIYDCINSYDHNDLEEINLIKSHEIGHCFEVSTPYTWLKEGMNSLSQYEYFGYYAGAYDDYMVISKYFFELLGTDTMLDAYYDNGGDKLSELLQEIDSSIDADKFLKDLNSFASGSSESFRLIGIMKSYADSALIDDDNKKCIDSYLDYLSLKSDCYPQRGYISSEYKSGIEEGAMLVKKR